MEDLVAKGANIDDEDLCNEVIQKLTASTVHQDMSSALLTLTFFVNFILTKAISLMLRYY